MTYSDLLLSYARKGPFGPIRRSAFRKFCRRNTGRSITARCTTGFSMNTIIGDSVDNNIAVYGCFESGTTYVVEQLARASSAFVDIGCNIGYYSCLFAAQNPGKRVLSIDPNPAMIARTKENLTLNRAANYELLNCGIGESEGTLTLHIPEFRHSLSSFAYVPAKGGRINTVEAEIRPLPEVLREHSIDASFVKMDTEGYEVPIFSGLTEEAVARIRFFLFELSSANLRQAGHSAAELFALPVLSEFDTYFIRNGGGGFLERADPERIRADTELSENMLLVRKDAESKDALEHAALRCR